MSQRIINIKLIDKRKQRFAVEFDNCSSIILTAETILKNNLRRNKELSAEELEKILSQDEYIRARATAIAYLTLRTVSKNQLSDYLRKKGFGKENIRRVIAELSEKNHISDERFAQLFVKDRMKLKPSGPLKLAAELRKRGVSAEIVNSTISSLLEPMAQKALALELARKKLNALRIYNFKHQRQKLYDFLRRKGFEDNIVSEVMQNIFGELAQQEYD